MEAIIGVSGLILSIFGGISLVIWTSMQAKIARIKAERDTSTPSRQSEDSAVLAELRALKQQMAEMHSTGHQFDLSFDDALNRLEGRVGQMETKSATRGAAAEDAPAVQQNGTGHSFTGERP